MSGPGAERHLLGRQGVGQARHAGRVGRAGRRTRRPRDGLPRSASATAGALVHRDRRSGRGETHRRVRLRPELGHLDRLSAQLRQRHGAERPSFPLRLLPPRRRRNRLAAIRPGATMPAGAAWSSCWSATSPTRLATIREFPFLRSFDPYAGHSWACGHARFGDGNNQESSSEAMNAWCGLILWGEATGDRALRDLGIYLFTTELAAINAYWFDVLGENRPADFPQTTLGLVWGGKADYGTWFSAKPENIYRHQLDALPRRLAVPGPVPGVRPAELRSRSSPGRATLAGTNGPTWCGCIERWPTPRRPWPISPPGKRRSNPKPAMHWRTRTTGSPRCPTWAKSTAASPPTRRCTPSSAKANGDRTSSTT